MSLECDFSDLINKLVNMEKKVKKEIADKALDKGADIILQGQKNNAPVDTGRLKNSLVKGDKKGTGEKREINIGLIKADRDVARYGYVQKHGTSSMNGKKWIKNAWASNKQQANEAIKESIMEDLLK